MSTLSLKSSVAWATLAALLALTRAAPAQEEPADATVRTAPTRPEAPATNENAAPEPPVPPEMLVPASEAARPSPEAQTSGSGPSSPASGGAKGDQGRSTAPAANWLEAQVELARRGFSCGPIDGVVGTKTRGALGAFQRGQQLPPTGELDAETRARLALTAPPFKQASLSASDLASLQPLEKTWLGKSQQTALAFESALEAVAERFHAHPGYLRQINPSLDWDAITPETPITVPAVERVRLPAKAARLHISLTDCVLEAFDRADNVIAHFPVSIGATAEKQPAGELHITTTAVDPNFTFDPAVFPESPEAHELLAQGRRLILPPGPNNPVGVAWIGLDRPGYGIHGTPSPERVGRAESHGCFRLANWDARTLLSIVRVGLPVQIEP